MPTNQIEQVVKAVLGMVGTKATKLPKRSSSQNMRREMGHWADVVAGVELATAHHVTGASDDTTKRQRTIAADLTHHLLPDGTRRTLCIGLSCMARGTAASKAEHFEKRMKAVQAAAKLSVPTFHGAVEAFDRVTLGHLITCWDCDRAITERNAAQQIEERKTKEVRAREGARRLQELEVGKRVWVQLRVRAGEGGVPTVEAPLVYEHRGQRLAEVHEHAKQQLEGADGAALAQMSPDQREEMVKAEMARLLGQEWWDGLDVSARRELTAVYAATCNAHRWVNVGKGLDEGIQEVFKAIKAEKRALAGDTSKPPAGEGGAPWDRLIYEVAKLLCMNARKMNVAIGQDLLGYQVVELGKSPKDCLHLTLKVRGGWWVVGGGQGVRVGDDFDCPPARRSWSASASSSRARTRCL